MSLLRDDQIVVRVKAELRKRMRALRNTTPSSACLARSESIVAALLARDEVRAAKKIALFWPIVQRHEVDLRTLDVHLRAAGASVAYPTISPETREMQFRFTDSASALEERGFGFAEPGDEAVEATSLDVMIIPALAVDSRGQRLGYGAGFYDRALPHYAPPAVTIAVAYDFQLLAEIPISELDFPVDWIVTDKRTLKAER